MSKFRRLIMQRNFAPAPPEKPNLATVTECDTSFSALIERTWIDTPLKANLLKDHIYKIEFDCTLIITDINGSKTASIYVRGDKKNILGVDDRQIAFGRLLSKQPTSESDHVSDLIKARNDTGELDTIIQIDAQNGAGKLLVTNLKITEA